MPAIAALPAAVGGQALPSLAPMLQRVMPAVVSVHSQQRVRINNPFANDPMFRRMFPNVPQERISQSLGSGVIVDAAKGLVLTNHHVIEGADEVSVTLADGRTLKAEFVGSDPDTDIALMRIPVPKDMPLAAIQLADSSKLHVGDFVVAVGNPFGIGQTVTSGIVSAVGRSGLRGLGYQNFIQTDASINPGNSGGALVNLNGELVGINTASFNPQGSMAGNIGLGFAIPSNLARDVLRQLAATGEVRRGSARHRYPGRRCAAGERPGPGRGARRGGDAGLSGFGRGRRGTAAGRRGGRRQRRAHRRPRDAAQLRRPAGGRRAGRPWTCAATASRCRSSATLREQARALDGGALDPRLAGATFVELPERLRQAGAERRAGRERRPRQPRRAAADLQGGRRDRRRQQRCVSTTCPASAPTSLQRPPQLVLRIVRGTVQGNLLMQLTSPRALLCDRRTRSPSPSAGDTR